MCEPVAIPAPLLLGGILMKMSLIALLWAASGQTAAFLCCLCGSLEASVAVYQLSASRWLTLRDRASAQRRWQRQRQRLPHPQTGKHGAVFFFSSLWTPDPSSLKHPRHRRRNICLLKSHVPSSSPQPSFVFMAQICRRTRDQSGG